MLLTGMAMQVVMLFEVVGQNSCWACVGVRRLISHTGWDRRNRIVIGMIETSRVMPECAVGNGLDSHIYFMVKFCTGYLQKALKDPDKFESGGRARMSATFQFTACMVQLHSIDASSAAA